MSGGLDSAIAISLKQNNYRDIKMYSANFSHLPPVTRSRIDEKGYQKNISELLVVCIKITSRSISILIL